MQPTSQTSPPPFSSPHLFSPLRSQGLEALQHGEYDSAVTVFSLHLNTHPDDLEVQVWLGVAYSQQGEHEQALRLLQEAVEARPDLHALHYNLGLALERAGQAAEAAAEYRRTLDAVPAAAQAGARLQALAAPPEFTHSEPTPMTVAAQPWTPRSHRHETPLQEEVSGDRATVAPRLESDELESSPLPAAEGSLSGGLVAARIVGCTVVASLMGAAAGYPAGGVDTAVGFALFCTGVGLLAGAFSAMRRTRAV